MGQVIATTKEMKTFLQDLALRLDLDDKTCHIFNRI